MLRVLRRRMWGQLRCWGEATGDRTEWCGGRWGRPSQLCPQEGAPSENFGGETGGNFPLWTVGSNEQRSMNTHCATPVKENRTQCKRRVNEGKISQRRTLAKHWVHALSLRRITFWFRWVTDVPFLFFWLELLAKDSFFTWSPPSKEFISSKLK